MNKRIDDESKFIINEYLEVNVKQDLVQVCSDCYRALGWTILTTSEGLHSVTLKLQRDRKVKNRIALYDLQHKCEAAFVAIEKLEKFKLAKAMAASLGAGLLGTALIVGSVVVFQASIPFLGIILFILGMIGCGSAYFLHSKYLKEGAEKVKPMIDKNYDVIDDACEKAQQLIRI